MSFFGQEEDWHSLVRLWEQLHAAAEDFKGWSPYRQEQLAKHLEEKDRRTAAQLHLQLALRYEPRLPFGFGCGRRAFAFQGS